MRRAGAPDAARRLSRIDEHARRADFATLERLADPDLAADELSAALSGRIRLAQTVRNAAALLPLLVTWLSLAFASKYYNQELQAHPALGTRPFLLLWEQGFGRGFFSFATVAGTDFALLVLVLGLTGWVHYEEGRTARREGHVLDSLYSAMSTLEAAMRQGLTKAPASAEEWAEAASRIIGGAMEETRLLAATSQQAITLASDKLTGIQDQGKEFIGQFSTEVQATLAAVRRDNEQFINRTATEARETLQRLVELQMAPLVKQLTDMLAELAKHQETYRAGVSDLSLGVSGIRDAARELASSAKAYDRIADALARNLGSIEASQREFTTTVASSAASMTTSATAIGGFEGSLGTMRDGVDKVAATIGTASAEFQASMRDMRDGVEKVATTVSKDIEAVQRKLASTSTALNDSSSALSTAARDLRAASWGGPGRRPWFRRSGGR
ncbi:MAG TPA: hypothetical protein VH478_16375 [Trebonia sp.]|nr:hypothetical protein [Trebonia sp.]